MKRRSNRIIIGLVAASVLLVGLNAIGVLGPLKRLVGAATNPLVRSLTHSGLGLGTTFDVIGSARSLASQNQRLQSENQALRQQVVADTELRAQNDELRKQLKFNQISTDRLMGAEVVSYQPDNFRQVVMIDRGSKDGVHSGMAVISQGSLVGTVSDVSGSSAKVFLLIDPNFRVNALDQSQSSRPTGTVQGQIGGGLLMDKIAQNEPVHSGDTVVTSGLGDLVPKGIEVGRVQSVSAKDNGVFQTAQLTSELNFNRLDLVYLVVQ
jgi:rod shape-determining protein MreC